jgi:hypothetical protein
MRAFVAIAMAIGILACANPAAAETIKLHKQIWEAYQSYLKAIGSTKPGAYAVAEDGRAGAGWVCPDTRCTDMGRFSTEAKEACQKLTDPGVKCVLFAVRDDIRIEYEIVE